MRSRAIISEILKKQGTAYEYIREIRKEKFSDVSLVRNKEFNREEILKVMAIERINDMLDKDNKSITVERYEKIKERFLMESTLSKKTDSPNIAKVYKENFIENIKYSLPIPYFLQEYVHGRSLKELLEEKGILDIQEVLDISDGILNVLSILHKFGMIYRALNPSNIIISSFDGHAVLTNFNMVKNIQTFTSLTAPGAPMENPEYIAPEQFEDHKKTDTRTDIYAFGVILFEILTGKPPFVGNIVKIMKSHKNNPIPNIRQKNPAVPMGLQKIIEKAMSKRKEDRYPNVEEILKLIKQEKNSLHHRKRLEFKKIFGTIEYDEDYDYKAERRKR